MVEYLQRIKHIGLEQLLNGFGATLHRSETSSQSSPSTLDSSSSRSQIPSSRLFPPHRTPDSIDLIPPSHRVSVCRCTTSPASPSNSCY
jgi:hypothetical protein